MKNQLLILLFSISFINCYAQITFEKGYYINNNNETIECQIKNLDWRNNPTEFEYRLQENSESKKESIKLVKEFGINNISKYVRSTVNIDRSSDVISNMNYDKNPIFKEEVIFLKVLLEGKSNLYEYIDSNLRRYFYTNSTSNIEQLVRKSYKTHENQVAENTTFRNQLWNDLKCPSISINRVKTVDYTKKDLIKFFTLYSTCHKTEFSNFKQKEKRDFFNLTLRPRINSSSLTMMENSQEMDYGTKIGLGFGVESEFILPFKKGKWSILIEPTFQYFKYKNTTESNNVFGGELTEEVDYNSIEIPISLRHYFFINPNSKIFINASIVTDLTLGSTIEFTRKDGSTINSLKLDSRNNLAMGLGYKHNDTYSFEIRYQTSREVLEQYGFLKTDYKTLSFIVGYSIM
ncbi:tRNA modification GTPase [Mariniflexile sp. AS56]|uniref:tRNA modification GTPase n=1 Tax=Mariniflexile sp. AS56 TaxID=3063957 RepID=UPI0026F2A693|nr:tRNA modification GTPase [Mariniflexile sp. AS56]MDO7173331.1 tRNA modification GTPase [Mariniflexile sp. AS56]